MRDQEIELMEIGGVWQVRTPKSRAKRHVKREKITIWGWLAATYWIWLSVLMALALSFTTEAHHMIVHYTGLVVLLSVFFMAFRKGVKRTA